MTSPHLHLRERREARGLSLEEAAGATRIAVRYLSAIEHGRIDELPEGPKRRSFVLSYAAFLEVDPAVIAPLVPPSQPAGASLNPVVVWAAAATAVVLGLLLLGGQIRDWWARPPAPEVPEVARVERADADQLVALRVMEAGRFRVWVDGELVIDKQLPVDERVEVAGHDRVEVELPTAGSARVVYNGESIAPQGRLDEPRRLVFIDDLQAL